MFSNIITKLLDLLRESVITQSLLVIFIFGPIAYCAILGLPQPEDLVKFGWVIIGFFFGAKSAYTVMKGRKE